MRKRDRGAEANGIAPHRRVSIRQSSTSHSPQAPRRGPLETPRRPAANPVALHAKRGRMPPNEHPARQLRSASKRRSATAYSSAGFSASKDSATASLVSRLPSASRSSSWIRLQYEFSGAVSMGAFLAYTLTAPAVLVMP